MYLEIKIMSSKMQLDTRKEDDHGDEVPLPGFRFHPTDEELVGFYLRRKVEKKPIRLELIKQIDIYKYDPWNLPKAAGSTAKDTEWYFFCKRGRKYRNSIRPNRVTGSGFWKATGIDKHVYSAKGSADRQSHHVCIGLKKTLVYYRGSAGKGTKTDWMMHEFRLPADHDTNTNLSNAKSTAPEAEIWTLCRVFERNVSHRKYTPDWRALSAKRPTATYSSSEACSLESNNREGYITFGSSTTPFVNYNDHEHNERKPVVNHNVDEIWNQLHVGQLSATAPVAHERPPSSSGFPIGSPDRPDENYHALFDCGNWDDELRSVVEFALNPSSISRSYITYVETSIYKSRPPFSSSKQD
ncbi:hypothetical protein I3843_11G064000 [Carya illinoinensis]|nr:hypothetical protein I3843_11G064000 [Carya illinoinensis]